MKKFLASVVAGVLVLGMAACTPKDADNKNGGETNGTQTEANAEDVNETRALKVGYMADPEGLDPQKTSAVSTFNVTGNIYESLIAVTPEFEFEPRLCEEYTLSEDGLSITFNLKEGVKFHDGSEMTSDDVKFSFERLKEEDSPKASSYKNIVDITCDDDYTITFKTETLDVDLAKAFAYPWAVVMPAEVDVENLKTNPVGTGAYKFVSWTPQEKVLLERFDDYHGEKAIIKNVELYLISDYTTALAALTVGDADIIEVSGDQIDIIEGTDGLSVFTQEMNAVQLLGVNNADPVLSDLRVRQAIALALNKQEIIDNAIWGYGTVIGSALPTVSPDFVDTTDVYPQDIERAKELLAEAGYADGLTLKLKLPKDYPIHVDTGLIIADQLAKIGITAEVEVIEWGTWMSDVYTNRDYQMTVVNLSGKLDTQTFLKRYMSTGSDFVKLDSGEVDEILSATPSMTDEAARHEAYVEVQKIIAEKLPAIYIQTMHKIFGINDDVQGFRMYPVDIYEYKNVSFK